MTREDKWKYMTLSGAIVGGPTDLGLFQFPFSSVIAMWRMKLEAKRAMKAAQEMDAVAEAEVDVDASASGESRYAQASLNL